MAITASNRATFGPPLGLTFAYILSIPSRIVDVVVDTMSADIERLLSPDDIDVVARLAASSFTSLETACSSK